MSGYINIKKSWAVSRINFNRLWLAAAIIAVTGIASGILNLVQFFTIQEGNQTVSGSNFFLGICIFLPIFLASDNFYKTMRLNAKKKDYFFGAFICLVLIAAITAFTHEIWFYATVNPLNKVTPFVPDPTGETYGTGFECWSLYKIFGFSASGPIIGYFQMFGFLFFCSVFIFILTSIQDKWIGWASDVFIIACISVFSSIAALRTYLWKPFFTATIFGHPVLQILFTVLGGLAFYLLYLPILKRKKI